MKNNSFSVNLLLVIVVVVLLFAPGQLNARAQAPAPQSAAQDQPGCSASRSVQVSGTALLNVPPDRALIQLGVQSNGNTPEMAQNANTAAIQRVIQALRALGIESRDISTDVFMVEPIYDSYSSLYIKGYRSNNLVAVTVRDVKLANPAINAALSAGANQVMSAEFYTSQLRQFRDQARELAVRAAREKAQALADAAGTETGCVLHISENSWSYYNGWWWGHGRDQQWTQNVVQNVAGNTSQGSGGNGEEPVSPGQVSVKAQVEVTFGLK